VVERSFVSDEDVGRPLARRTLQRVRSVEGYLRGGDPPRWMRRLGQIDRGIADERRRLGEAYEALRARCGDDREQFARRWRQTAEAWSFDELNVLIEQHNEWYPVERRLAMDPRTGDYVLIHGRSYRRPVLGPDWVLENFPA
jgi:hypothetical protein